MDTKEVIIDGYNYAFMDKGEILADEELMEFLGKIAEQKGRILDEVVEDYQKDMNDTLAQVSDEYWNMLRLISSFTNKKEYKTAI